MMKKIIATVAAAALAVSAMATAAFADVTVAIANDTTQKNATVTLTTGGTLEAANGTLSFDVTGTKALQTDTIVKTEVTLKAITGDTVTTVTKSADGAEVEFTTDTGASFKDISKMAEGAGWEATIVVTVKGSVAYTASDAGAYAKTVAVAGSDDESEAAGGKVTVLDDTTVTGTVGGYTFDSTKLTVAERAEAKTATKAVLTLTFNKASTVDNGLVTLTKGGAQAAVAIAAKGATTATFDLAIADFYNAQYDAFEAPVYAWTIVAGGANAIASASLVFVAGAEAEETTTTIAEEVETTTEAPAVDETTAADADVTTDAAGATDGKGDNTNTGVALAVIPAIVAGAAVVVSRKRK